MRTKTIKVYKLEELKKDIQEDIINKFRENEEFYFLEEYLKDYLKQVLEENKLKVIELNIEYDLNYSQGSGFCFYGIFDYNGRKFIIKKTDRHYNHKYTTNVYLKDLENLEENDNITEMVLKKLEQNFKELYLNICDKLEKYGYDIIEDSLKEENIRDLIKSNEYEFLENGVIA